MSAGDPMAAAYDRAMAYDEVLASRIGGLLDDEPAVSEKAMFGGLGFFVGGNLAVCASNGGGLLVRVDPESSEELVASAGVSFMEMRGRPWRGWLLIDADHVRSDQQLGRWVTIGVTYARSLPLK